MQKVTRGVADHIRSYSNTTDVVGERERERGRRESMSVKVSVCVCSVMKHSKVTVDYFSVCRWEDSNF